MENTHNDEMEIDLMELFYALKRRIFFILAVGLLCGCLSAAYTNFFMTPIYTSTSSMLVLTKETTLSLYCRLADWKSVNKRLHCTDNQSRCVKQSD